MTDERHDRMQERLVADPTYRRLLFDATSQVCSDVRCQTCPRHSEALAALHRRGSEILDAPTLDPDDPEAGGHEYMRDNPLWDDPWVAHPGYQREET